MSLVVNIFFAFISSLSGERRSYDLGSPKMIPRPASVELLDSAAAGGGGGGAGQSSSSSAAAEKNPGYADLPQPQTKCQTCTGRVRRAGTIFGIQVPGDNGGGGVFLLFVLQLRTCLVGFLERLFFRYGRCVARWPVAAIFLCILVALGCGAGMTKFTKESTVTRQAGLYPVLIFLL